MKTSTECKNIDQIRECIDLIDKKIIECLAERSNYVKAASEFKKTITDVSAADRVVSMMKTRRNLAVKNGIDPDFVEGIFNMIIKYFIATETVQWEKKHAFTDSVVIQDAIIEDAWNILFLQKRAFVQEAELIQNYNIQPLTQSYEEIQNDFKRFTIIKALLDCNIIGSARAELVERICYIGRVVVEPFYQKKGIGKVLMNTIESRFPNAMEFELFTGAKSAGNLQFYSKLGYSIIENFTDPDGVLLVRMRKKNVFKL